MLLEEVLAETVGVLQAQEQEVCSVYLLYWYKRCSVYLLYYLLYLATLSAAAERRYSSVLSVLALLLVQEVLSALALLLVQEVLRVLALLLLALLLCALLGDTVGGRRAQALSVLSLLALLVQTHKY
jgi:hypothetical protein